MKVNCKDNFIIDVLMLERLSAKFPKVDGAMFVNMPDIGEVRPCKFICHYMEYNQYSSISGSVVELDVKIEKSVNTKDKLGVVCNSKKCFNRDTLAQIAKHKIFDKDWEDSKINNYVYPELHEVVNFSYILNKDGLNMDFTDIYTILVTFTKDFDIDRCWLINTTSNFPELSNKAPEDDILCDALNITSYLELPELKTILVKFLKDGKLSNG